MMRTLPPVLTIAGSDCSAGAGIQADLKAISAMGGYALTALTSVVSESPGRVSRIGTLQPDLIQDQIYVLFDAYPIRAAKVGMTGGVKQVEAISEAWRKNAWRYLDEGVPLVVDPVMVATSGASLLEPEAISALKSFLLPLAALITPNLDEAAVLWGQPVTTREAMAACAQELAASYQTSILVKGGHLHGDAAADVLCHPGGLLWLESERVPGVQTHGTGCTYSAAIATGLARSIPLVQAVSEAKAMVTRSIAEHFTWKHEGKRVHALNPFYDDFEETDD
jgi:hydroxymethylpyrimidine/phosphomethylpyrimidine kinase